MSFKKSKDLAIFFYVFLLVCPLSSRTPNTNFAIFYLSISVVEVQGDFAFASAQREGSTFVVCSLCPGTVLTFYICGGIIFQSANCPVELPILLSLAPKWKSNMAVGTIYSGEKSPLAFKFKGHHLGVRQEKF
jgi:hypothetical protein